MNIQKNHPEVKINFNFGAGIEQIAPPKEILSKPINENVKTMTTLKEALEKIRQLKSTYYFERESEHVSIPDSVGRELSEAIVADCMSPAFDIAAMDGFAVRSEDVYPLKIKGSVYAGDQRAEIKSGTEIFNGMIKNTSSVLIQGFMKEMGCEAILRKHQGQCMSSG